MKTMKSKQFLFLAALGCMTAPVAAQTVDVSINCGQSYTINSTVDASGAASITYRWLENGSTVTPEGEAYTSYTVPKTKNVGVYTYIRQAKSAACPDWQSSNAFTVEVKNKNADGVCLGGVMWAKYNVDEPGSFTTAQDARGKFYRFNSNVPIPSSGTCSWPEYEDDGSAEWSTKTDPCPPGWRVPTYLDRESLMDTTIGLTSLFYKSNPAQTYAHVRCARPICSAADTSNGTGIAVVITSARNCTNDTYNYTMYWLAARNRIFQPFSNAWIFSEAPENHAVAVRCVGRN
jgi:hypothetical protein